MSDLPALELDDAAGERYLTEYGPFHVALVKASRFDLLDKNARYMRAETMERLSKNIARDGALSGAVFGWRRAEDPQRFLTLSGNHRIKGVRRAKVALVLVVYTEADLDRDEQVAIQLSHNAVVGDDDLTILKSLWEEMGDLDAKEYAGLDDRTLETLEKLDLSALVDVQLDYRSVTFLFLPDEVDRAREAFSHARVALDARGAFVARIADYDRTMAALATAQASYDVRNVAVAMMLLLDVAQAHVDDFAEGWDGGDAGALHGGWVPVETIIGSPVIPAEAAVVLKRAVERLVGRGHVNERSKWKALELLAAEYLGGA